MSKFSEALFTSSCNIVQIDKTIEYSCQMAIQSPKAFYNFMQRYTHFNAYAGSLVARLASSIGLSRHLFKSASCLTIDESDRGIEVAAKILAATIDEHSDSKIKGLSHRLLAQSLLRSVGDYAALTVHERNYFSTSPPWIQSCVEDLIEGYQGLPNRLDSLVKAIGFHIASEMLADREFMIIDRVVRHDNYGHGFDAYLRTHANKLQVLDHHYSTWYWIVVHGNFNGSGVEAEHFQLAIEALNLAAEYSSESDEKFQTLALQGFLEFVEIQQRLFKEIHKECSDIVQTLSQGSYVAG